MRKPLLSKSTVALAGLVVFMLGSVAEHVPAQGPKGVELFDVRVISIRHHDTTSYTQGLELDGSLLFESGGRYGESTLREVEPYSGVVLRKIAVPDQYFAEGLTIVGDKIYQITWREGTALVYDKNTMSQVSEFTYSGEGWGIAYDGEKLIMSDGTNKLTYRDPETFESIGETHVQLNGNPLNGLNELEYVNGSLYANVYRTTVIARIDPMSGTVTGLINAGKLLSPQEQASASVMNGIAYDESTDSYLITGKNWPKMFEVEFVPRAEAANGLQLF